MFLDKCLKIIFWHSAHSLHSVGFVFFAVQKRRSLMKSHLSILTSVVCAFGVLSKNLWLYQCLPLYYLLVVSCFAFRSLIHLELGFHLWRETGSSFTFSICIYPDFPESFTEETLPSPRCVLGTLVKVGMWINF
jgi:hypothetical protein